MSETFSPTVTLPISDWMLILHQLEHRADADTGPGLARKIRMALGQRAFVDEATRGLSAADWDEAIARAADAEQRYTDLSGAPGINVMPVLAIIADLKRRFGDGERTRDLYEQMINT